MKPDFWDLLTLSNSELVLLRDVPAAEVTRLRESTTGHTRRLGAWVASIGGWGGLKTVAEISAEVGIAPGTTRAFVRYRKLKTRTPRRQRTQAQLALLSYASRPQPARAACLVIGILPCECVLYRAAAQRLIDATVEFSEILEWTPDRLEREWSRLGLVIEPPPPRPGLSEDEIRKVAAKVEGDGKPRRGTTGPPDSWLPWSADEIAAIAAKVEAEDTDAEDPLWSP